MATYKGFSTQTQARKFKITDFSLIKQDLLNHIEALIKPSGIPAMNGRQEIKVSMPVSPAPTLASASTSFSGNVEIIEMDRMRKLIADHMVMSKQTSPHVTSYVEADVTNLVNWRERIKGDFEKREKEKITYTPLFIEAVCKAIKDFPMVNVSVDGTKIIVKKYINIGMAAALPTGLSGRLKLPGRV